MPTFISYSQKDTELYENLCRELDKRGIKRWDSQTMSLTRELSDQLRDGVNSCGDCIFLATRNSLESDWVLAEVGAFWGAGKTVRTFVPDERAGGAAPEQFKHKVWTSDLDKVTSEIKDSRLKSPEEAPGPLVFVADPEAERDAAKLAVIRDAWAQQPGAPEEARPCYEFSDLSRVVDGDDLAPRTGLLLTTPYGQKLTEGLIASLVGWVRKGGRLAVTCFELGERHHVTNVNQLTYHFGVRFNSDVVVKRMPDGLERSRWDKDYGKTLLYDHILEPQRSLFRGVNRLAMRSACSLQLEPGAAPLLLATPNQMIELLPAEEDYYSGPPEYKLAAGEQVFDKPYQDEKRAVIALAPRGLTRAGRVLALGTWDFQGGGAESDNGQFLRNLYDWLTGREMQAHP